MTWTCGHVLGRCDSPIHGLVAGNGRRYVTTKTPHTELLGPPRDSPIRLLKLSVNIEYIQYFKCNPYGRLVPGSLVCVLMPSSLRP